MISASLYQTLYLILVTIITLAIRKNYTYLPASITRRSNRGEQIFTFALVVFLILFIGYRPLSTYYFCDMSNYAMIYEENFEGYPFVFEPKAENLIFDNLLAYIGSKRLGYTFFFVIISAIYFSTAYIGIRRLFPNNTLAAYLIFLAAFCTFSMATNGIKAGAAASIFLMAMGYRNNLMICVPLMLLSLGFHHSMIMPIGAFIITMFIKNSKWYFYLWFFCFLMALGHVTTFAGWFASMADDNAASYLLSNQNGLEGTRGGLRLDFILYSLAPVAIGYYYIMKKNKSISPLYRDLLNIYLCTNGIWMLCMYASFTNRIAFLSWLFYPIVLIYPFLNENLSPRRYQYFERTMMYHLYFTLFMNGIYYQFIR